jgi:hypothetical protein
MSDVRFDGSGHAIVKRKETGKCSHDGCNGKP